MVIRGEKEEYTQVLHPYPEYLMIEPTNECTLNCISCSRQSLRELGNMDYQSFCYVMEQFPKLNTVKFHGLGEALITPNALQKLSYLKERECSTIIVTNCQWRQLDVQYLMDCIEHMYISVSGADKESYEAFHRGGSWEILMRNIRHVLKFKKDGTDIVINFVCTKVNLEQIPKVVILANEVNVRAVRFQILQNWLAEEDPLYKEIEILRVQDIKLLARQFQKSVTIARKLDVDIEVVGNENFNFNQCVWPFSRCYITWKGEVIPCCMRPDQKFSMGNIFQSFFPKIWMNHKYQYLREALKANTPPSMCQICPYLKSASTVKLIKSILTQ